MTFPEREGLLLPPVKDLFGLVQVDVGLAVPEAPVALQPAGPDQPLQGVSAHPQPLRSLRDGYAWLWRSDDPPANWLAEFIRALGLSHPDVMGLSVSRS
jgi:hypothetical protein